MSCNLLLIRHGETVDNVNRIMQGQTPGRLTDNGVEQARLLGKQLAHMHIDAFVSRLPLHISTATKTRLLQLSTKLNCYASATGAALLADSYPTLKMPNGLTT